MPLENITVLSNLSNISHKALPIISNPSNIPSLAILIIIALLLTILFKIGLFALDSFVAFFSRFLVPIVVIGTAYFMAMFYYNSVYVPKIFNTTNTTFNVTSAIEELHSSTSMILLPHYYDTLLYYQTLLDRPVDEVLVTFIILSLLFIYLTHFVFWRYLNIYSIILTSTLFFILTLGAKGFIAAVMHYSLIRNIVIAYIVFYIVLILLKLKPAPQD